MHSSHFQSKLIAYCKEKIAISICFALINTYWRWTLCIHGTPRKNLNERMHCCRFEYTSDLNGGQDKESEFGNSKVVLFEFDKGIIVSNQKRFSIYSTDYKIKNKDCQYLNQWFLKPWVRGHTPKQKCGQNSRNS